MAGCAPAQLSEAKNMEIQSSRQSRAFYRAELQNTWEISSRPGDYTFHVEK
jgi:hypothetical protein